MSLNKQSGYDEAIQKLCKITGVRINKDVYVNENDLILLQDSQEIKTSSPV